jgi:hypothetical protein
VSADPRVDVFNCLLTNFPALRKCFLRVVVNTWEGVPPTNATITLHHHLSRALLRAGLVIAMLHGYHVATPLEQFVGIDDAKASP